ncbi:hypothetical protein ACH437_27695 [Streptomyces xinghaiensis]|uniref:hypothetical protein n=1 Tax=Streptomyces xinghaiensis TaxID=1038928 RepID=UPI0037BD22B6
MSTVGWKETKRRARERREAAGLPTRSAEEKQVAMDRLTAEATRHGDVLDPSAPDCGRR